MDARSLKPHDVKAQDAGEDLIAKARAMIPTLRERAKEDDARGAIRKETFDELRAAGLTRLAQPRRYGGLEQPLAILAQVEIELARGDQSASWAYAVTQGHAHHLSMFDDRAQRDVWGSNPDTLIASPYNPLGKAITHRDGYKFSGQWKYSSGCDHCDWFLLGGFVDGDESKFRTFLVPGHEVEIIDDWDVFGLKGTGSKSVRVKDSFVPGYRAVPFGPGTEDFDFPGFAVNSNPSLKIPYILVFNRSITATSIGGLAGMIDAVVDYLEPKISIITGKSVSVHPDTMLALGEAKATLEELKIIALHDLNALERFAREDRLPSESEINLFRYRAQQAGERCVQAGRRLFEESGGGGMYESLPIGRIYRNLVSARNHPAAAMFRDSARAIAANMFGKEAEKRRRF